MSEQRYRVMPREAGVWVVWDADFDAPHGYRRILARCDDKADANLVCAALNAYSLLERAEHRTRTIVNHLGPVVPEGLPDGADIEWAVALDEAQALLADIHEQRRVVRDMSERIMQKGRLHPTKHCPVCGARLMLGDPRRGEWHCVDVGKEKGDAFVCHYEASRLIEAAKGGA